MISLNARCAEGIDLKLRRDGKAYCRVAAKAVIGCDDGQGFILAAPKVAFYSAFGMQRHYYILLFSMLDLLPLYFVNNLHSYSGCGQLRSRQIQSTIMVKSEA